MRRASPAPWSKRSCGASAGLAAELEAEVNQCIAEWATETDLPRTEYNVLADSPQRCQPRSPT
ncbi:hypothetical protein ABZ499_15000 [Streptomyces sp. NPDC019990]|uniref:hypothetical protein n=1 Tax=Streptomyces sp. NPDC019990 TaxID=3154693 RepID=UPI0034025085